MVDELKTSNLENSNDYQSRLPQGKQPNFNKSHTVQFSYYSEKVYFFFTYNIFLIPYSPRNILTGGPKNSVVAINFAIPWARYLLSLNTIGPCTSEALFKRCFTIYINYVFM